MSGEIMCRIKFRARHRLNKMVVNADSFTVAAMSSTSMLRVRILTLSAG